jgi:hypothetical protein
VSAPNDTSADPDIERTFHWLLSFLPSGEWERRRSAIEQHLESILFPKVKPNLSEAERAQFHRLIGTEDRIGWYLYLVETSLYEPYRTEVNQASRVLPIFRRLGTELDLLQKIGGVEAKVKKLLSPSEDKPDSILFEMLIAMLWVRNGWQDVAFIPAHPSEKRPDIRAANGADEWFIETKRMTTHSEYSLKERDKWLRMWSRLTDCLVREGRPFVLDITFHVELETLDDDFVRDQLAGKLELVACPCELISNKTWDVSVRFVDFAKIREHLRTQSVKHHSRQLQELVGGRWERDRGFTFVMNAECGRVGGDRGINLYVNSIRWAAGAYWRCDAERAYEKKARDIRAHLANAVEQLPADGCGVIHVGIETFDGETVELERFGRILDTVRWFDPRGKDLRWVYCHLYESYAPPDKPWYIDETYYRFGASKTPNPEPISRHATVVPNEEGARPGMHWLRKAP